MRTWKLVLLLVAIAALPRLVALFGVPLVAERVDLSMGATVEKIKAHAPEDDRGYIRFVANRIRVYPLTEDEKTYDELAVNALAGKGFSMDNGWYIVPPGKPTSYWNCLYPLFITGTYAVFGQRLLAVFLLQILFGSLSCAVIYFTGKRLIGKAAGLAAFGFACVYPPYVLNSIWMMTEALCVPLVIFGLYFYSRALDDRRLWAFAVAGALFGAAAITRSTVFYFIPLLALVTIIILKGRLRLLSRYIPAFLAAAFLVILPWTYRNYRVHNAFMLIDTKVGVSLWMFNNPNQVLGYKVQNSDMPLLVFGPGATEVEMDRAYFELGKDYVRSHKAQFLKTFGIKAILALNPIPKQLNSPRAKLLGLFTAGWMLILTPVGIVVTRGRWRRLYPLYTLMAYWILIQAGSAAGMRYRLPAEVAWILFAAAGGVWVYSAVARRVKRKPDTTSGKEVVRREEDAFADAWISDD